MEGTQTVIVAGAGIGGLTAALALARKGFRVTVLEQAARLEEAGAGIQLSPNAARLLIALGLKERLQAHVTTPALVAVRSGRTAREIVRIPLGDVAAQRYGAPYWVIHRGDLQAALVQAVRDTSAITLQLGTKVAGYTTHADGITVQTGPGTDGAAVSGIALIGADGLWSAVRTQLHGSVPPRFGRRTAWRATVPAQALPDVGKDVVGLWLGTNAHLVHYPIKAGALVNVVAIVQDTWDRPGWSEAGERDELMARFTPEAWSAQPRAIVATPDRWLKWALFDRPPVRRWGDGPVTLLGDAAHPTLPFVAQGAAMAIEDAAVLADCLARDITDPARALRTYEDQRQARTARVRRAARVNRAVYHLGGPVGFGRDTVMRMLGGVGLLANHDWLYGWRIDAPSR